MQDLLVIKAGQAIVQCSESFYTDTIENFVADGGLPLPENVKSIDYNKTAKSCWINDKAFQAFPNAYAEEVLALVPTLCESFEARKKEREEKERIEREEAERIQQEKEEADRLANMTQEEKDALALEQAKAERAEAVSRIVVDVDGMSFDGDEESQGRLSRTISAAVALGVDLDTYTQTWVLADNTIAQPTIKQLAEALKLAGEAQTALWTVPYSE